MGLPEYAVSVDFPYGFANITRLWNIIKDEDRTFPVAQLAEEHFRQHGRPLRIAVDEADWRFNNLTSDQVYVIRASLSYTSHQA